MKKRISIILAVALVLTLLTGTVAYAANGDRINNAIDKAQERLQRLEEIKPLIDKIVADRAEIATLKSQLITQRQEAKKHIQDLKANLGSITSEQIEKLQEILSKIKDCRSALDETNTQFLPARQNLITARQSKNYDAVKIAYTNIISIQGKRIEQIKNLTELYKQIPTI